MEETEKSNQDMVILTETKEERSRKVEKLLTIYKLTIYGIWTGVDKYKRVQSGVPLRLK